jgi:hypothetical protein
VATCSAATIILASEVPPMGLPMCIFDPHHGHA